MVGTSKKSTVSSNEHHGVSHLPLWYVSNKILHLDATQHKPRTLITTSATYMFFYSSNHSTRTKYLWVSTTTTAAGHSNSSRKQQQTPHSCGTRMLRSLAVTPCQAHTEANLNTESLHTTEDTEWLSSWTCFKMQQNQGGTVAYSWSRSKIGSTHHIRRQWSGYLWYDIVARHKCILWSPIKLTRWPHNEKLFAPGGHHGYIISSTHLEEPSLETHWQKVHNSLYRLHGHLQMISHIGVTISKENIGAAPMKSVLQKSL